ncbi:ATP synthase subunit delta', mitochondrial [Ananas comosus]|uniref:ATP synthase subunit delta', mitochondrial n=1 Tax=Ananas comosus TaxID=4615 RepID=A0A199UMH6_ANACO|nr:ATP synthase subunit delta', mitochondrial [Ananas comosus]
MHRRAPLPVIRSSAAASRRFSSGEGESPAASAATEEESAFSEQVRLHPWELCSQVEAFPVDHIDPSWVQENLADSTQNLSTATTDLEKAEVQIA